MIVDSNFIKTFTFDLIINYNVDQNQANDQENANILSDRDNKLHAVDTNLLEGELADEMREIRQENSMIHDKNK